MYGAQRAGQPTTVLGGAKDATNVPAHTLLLMADQVLSLNNQGVPTTLCCINILHEQYVTLLLLLACLLLNGRTQVCRVSS
jgi:hypothetical protein